MVRIPNDSSDCVISQVGRLFIRHHISPAAGQTVSSGPYTTTASQPQTEYALEMSCSNIRYGEGVTREVGMDFKNLGAKNICVMLDKNVLKLPSVHAGLESLDAQKLRYQVFDKIRVEPSDTSFKEAIDFAIEGEFDAFLAIGGGSVIDTCKAANLYSSNPKADFLDYVNAPIGRGLPVTHAVKPLIAVTTTAGTGSETTGVTVFDFKSMQAKTGIASRVLRPLLGIVDPLHVASLPERVAAYSGLDVLCHAIESYTALPYTQRSPRPDNPMVRPAYQGSNPISDIWCRHALIMCQKYLKRAVFDKDDQEARSAMHLASCYAGIGFGNSGVHLCHGMSYPISGLVRNYVSPDYDADHPLIPHGLSVIISAPAVFKFTAPACPERHLEAAQFLGADVSNTRPEDAGAVLSSLLRQYMDELKIPDGLDALGYTRDDIPALVKGTIPQHRVTKLSPRTVTEEGLTVMFEESMKVY